MTKTAYLRIVFTSGLNEAIRIDMNNKTSEHKLRNLMAGSITTFDILEEDASFTLPIGADSVSSQTRTIYPASVAMLDVKIVESDTLET